MVQVTFIVEVSKAVNAVLALLRVVAEELLDELSNLEKKIDFNNK